MNFVLTVAGQLLGFGTQLLLVPAFLGSWGESLYGDWLALSAASSYLAMTDMGMQVYVINYLTQLHVQDKHGEYHEVLHSALMLYGVLTAGVFVLLVGACVLPWRDWFNGHEMQPGSALGVVVTLGIGAVVGVWSGFIGALHRVFGAPHRVTAISVATRGSTLLATIVVLQLREGPVVLALVQVAILLASFAWSVMDVSLHNRVSLLTIRFGNWGRARSLLAPSLLFALLALASSLTIQGTVLVASSLLGPLAVTAYATSRTLANVIRQATNTLGLVAWPEFTRLEARGQSGALTSSYGLLLKVCSTLAVWLGAILWFEGAFLYRQWTRGAATLDQELLRYLLGHVVLHTPAAAATIYLIAINRYRQLAMLSFVQGVLTVGIALLLCWGQGVPGLGLALLLGEAPIAAALIPRWADEAMGNQQPRRFVHIYLPLIGSCALVAGVGTLCGARLPEGFPRLALATVATLVASVTAGWLWLNSDERRLIVRVGHKLSSRSG